MDTESKRTDTADTPFIAALKFIPLITFGLLVILARMDLLLAGPIATFVAALIHVIVNRTSFTETFEQGLHAVKRIVLVFFILMFANGMAECFMATGVGAALINLALRLGVTGRSIGLVTLLVTCLLSVATGTSWGTFAACAPIFLWLAHLVGGDVFLTVCCVAGGSCFGDNIGMISDCTVLSCGLMNIRIVDRLKHQIWWSVICLVLAGIVVYAASVHLPDTSADVSLAIESIPPESLDILASERPSALALLSQVREGVPYYLILPLILVIVLAFLGTHTLLCLGAGMVSSLLCGLAAGTVSLTSWLDDLLLKGFGSAGSWSVVMMMWISVFGGIMNSMNAFAPLVRLARRLSKNVHHLMGWCSVLCLTGNMALADETAQIATMSPIILEITEKNVEAGDSEMYKLRTRLATFTSAMGIYGSQLIPWHCFPVFFAGIASSVYPLVRFSSVDIIRYNYMSFIVIGSILLLTFTGLDRFIPGFGLPASAKLKASGSQKPVKS